MNYRSLNNITGWLVATIAFTVYLLTLEPTASFWDCGEFISCAYKLEVGHSPGAPFFMMMQRMFALLAGGDTSKVAMFINAESAVASAFTILFLFWTITHMARKVVSARGEEPAGKETLLVIGSGLVGALAYTFSDTFWFSAVEGEVYATSSFFTAIVFWAALKWEEQADNKYADRWLILIAFLIGISIGVHLLNLLAIPAVAMVYYFRRYETSKKGIAAAFFTGVLILAFVQFGVIQYVPIFASGLDLLFVNELGLPFNSGAIFSIILLTVLLVFALLYAKKRNWYLVHTSVLCVMFIMIGFSSYIVPVIRSSADTPVDMTNPDNPMSLVSYVQRTQYQQQPIATGPYYSSQVTGTEGTGAIYGKTTVNGKDEYEKIDEKISYKYEDNGKRFFPRIWDAEESHVRFYRTYLGLAEGEEPTARDNFSYFFNYQLGWMWWRYFMWNYSGRQNSYHGHGDAKHGNWITGIKPLDKSKVGDMDKMGKGFSDNMARNELYMLPFILGVLGMLFHFNRNKKDAGVTLILFFFTGIAIAIYLNMTPLQPRERDYAFAGGTYAFAIWIGMGVLMVHKGIQKILKNNIGAVVTILICLLAVPTLMAKEEWDDHDRSQRTQARASAYNALIGCAPNAVLFCSADNDTYPLWYLQEVEGIRKDVRVVIVELLGTDWYIDQLNYKINDADAVPMLWKKDDYKGGNHNYVPFYEHPQLVQDKYYDLEDICKFINSTDSRNKVQSAAGSSMNYLPAKNIAIKGVGTEEILKNGWAKDTTGLENAMKFTLDKKYILKNDLAVLHIIGGIAKEGWKRPIYFNGSYPGNGNPMGLGRYMHAEGINFRLLPFTNNTVAKQPGLQGGPVNIEKSIDLLMNKYQWGGAERNDIHFDDKHTTMMITYRLLGSSLSAALLQQGRKTEAIKVLDKVMTSISEHSYPYDLTTAYLVVSYYEAGAKDKAVKLAEEIIRNVEKDINWISSLDEDKQHGVAPDIQTDLTALNLLANAARQAGDAQHAAQWSNRLQTIYNKMMPVINAAK
jgi:tetratricopeptide (TPR) repeat protein